jgi:hypothetical protein
MFLTCISDTLALRSLPGINNLAVLSYLKYFAACGFQLDYWICVGFTLPFFSALGEVGPGESITSSRASENVGEASSQRSPGFRRRRKYG